jgi:hypothetical protein
MWFTEQERMELKSQVVPHLAELYPVTLRLAKTRLHQPQSLYTTIIKGGTYDSRP